jgi:flagellar capping protein FliD
MHSWAQPDGIVTLVDQMTTNTSSLLKAKTDSLSDQAKRLDDDIAASERRAELVERQLRQRFTALEMLVTQYKSQGNALAGLPTSNNR